MIYEITCTDNTRIRAKVSGKSGCYYAAKKLGKKVASYRRIESEPKPKTEIDKAKDAVAEVITSEDVHTIKYTPTCPICHKPIAESKKGKHCPSCGWGLRYAK